MPAHQQVEDITIQNGLCPRCSEAQRTQVHPATDYLVEQKDAGPFGVSSLYTDSAIKPVITSLFKNADTPHLNQDNNVNKRDKTATSVPDRWAPQTAVRAEQILPMYSSLRLSHRETKTPLVTNPSMRGQVFPTRAQRRLRHLMYRLRSAGGFSYAGTSTTLTYM